jgi:hypothetical protein
LSNREKRHPQSREFTEERKGKKKSPLLSNKMKMTVNEDHALAIQQSTAQAPDQDYEANAKGK